MERLTIDVCERDSCKVYPIVYGKDYKNNGDISLEECIDKLGKLEDIEQELGIDLIKLCKSFEEDIYIKPDDEIIFVRYEDKEFVFYEGNLICRTDKGNFTVSIDDYGKTWALTREELEKENK